MSANDDLPPVGALWRYAYEPDYAHSSRQHYVVWTYRVVSHREGRAVLEPLDAERVMPDGMSVVSGKLLAVPPHSIADLTSREQQSLRRAVDAGYEMTRFT